MNTSPIVKDVLLVGGGHSHVLLIRMWAMQAIPGVRLTLVSEKSNTPYSGMLPGLVAGHYTEDDVHIDLARLCSWAGIRFIEQRVSHIDLVEKNVSFGNARPALGFDILSLDTGSTPELKVPGSETFSVPVKPVHRFYSQWQALQDRIQSAQDRIQSANSALENLGTAQPVNVGVVGSGAGGFELVMSIRHALDSTAATCHWFIRGNRALKGRPEKVSTIAIQAAIDAGVVVHKNFDVVDVQHNALLARDERRIELDEIVWCAAAKAPSWPAQAGLATDKRGFVLTNEFLQSISHEYVFATGDIGTQERTPSDKAGVFAVRQAPFLFQNIRRYLLQKKLKPYKPQTDFLSLMATGKKSAIGNRGALCVQGSWVWWWKNRIDRQFMNRFKALPEMPLRKSPFTIPAALLAQSDIDTADASAAHMRCRGCGGKVGASILDSVLDDIKRINHSDCSSKSVLSGLEEASDAAVFKTDERAIVQSVDQISALCDDPYVFGRIAAVHALSDVYTSGATVHSAQVLVSLPFADKRIVKRDLTQLMSGVVDALKEDSCTLLGGHTAEGSDLTLGLVVNGLLDQTQNESPPKVAEGDYLILTKPLGTGVLLAGMMRQRAKGADVQSALVSMQKSNRVAAQILHTHGVKAVTDITGFGLMGHLQRLLAPLSVGASIRVEHVPLYSGALQLAENGVGSTLLEQNQQVLSLIDLPKELSAAWLNVLCDPQTSGGLLGVISATHAELVLEKLQEQGCSSARIIGKITSQNSISLDF